MKMVDAVVNGYIQVAVILLCVAFSARLPRWRR